MNGDNFFIVLIYFVIITVFC